MLDRRAFIYGTISVVVAGPRADGEQQAGRVWRIGIVSYPTMPIPSPPAPSFDALREALHELGWTEGRNIVLERRSAELDRIDELSAQIVREGFDVVLTIATPMARAMKKATAVAPIVMVVGSDPIRGGVVRQPPRSRGKRHGSCDHGPRACWEAARTARGGRAQSVPRGSRPAWRTAE